MPSSKMKDPAERRKLEVRLAAATGVDPRTVRRFLAGLAVRPYTAELLKAAQAESATAAG